MSHTYLDDAMDKRITTRAIAIIHHLDTIHHLCRGVSKAKMKDENVHTATSSSMIPPLPAIYIASSKGLAPN
eukprot:8397238-Ditylum_brightwellii.AAC.1